MKLIVNRISLLMTIVVILLWQGCPMTPEECKEFKADRINVKVKLYAHNLARNENNIKFRIEKVPCGESATGVVQLTESADQFGDYESTAYTYDLNNLFDYIWVNLEYVYSQDHNGLNRYEVPTLIYDTLKYHNDRTFELDLDYHPEAVHNLWKFWKENRARMPFCYHLPYYFLFGHLPQEGQDATYVKTELYDKMYTSGYDKRVEGLIDTNMVLQEGDIIFFGLDKLPDVLNAPHYAIVIDKNIWQIIPWGEKIGGEFDGPRDLAYFVKRPKMINPYTGEIVDPKKPYLYYMIYSK